MVMCAAMPEVPTLVCAMCVCVRAYANIRGCTVCIILSVAYCLNYGEWSVNICAQCCRFAEKWYKKSGIDVRFN